MITQLIHRAATGDRAAFDAAFAAIQLELRGLAARRLAADSRATLSPTMLVNETWLKLAGSVVRADDRAHFSHRRNGDEADLDRPPTLARG